MTSSLQGVFNVEGGPAVKCRLRSVGNGGCGFLVKVVVEVVIDRLDFVMEEGVESIAEVLGGWDVSISLLGWVNSLMRPKSSLL